MEKNISLIAFYINHVVFNTRHTLSVLLEDKELN